MIREELYHPMMVHFPIVLFILALVAKLVALSLYWKPELKEKFTDLSSLALYITPLFYLLSMYLGDMALDQIKNQFCDLRAVALHEEEAKFALIFVIFSLVLESARHIEKIKSKMPRLIEGLLVICLITGNALIFKTAHSGGELVYEKGAAVKNAAPEKCVKN